MCIRDSLFPAWRGKGEWGVNAMRILLAEDDLMIGGSLCKGLRLSLIHI